MIKSFAKNFAATIIATAATNVAAQSLEYVPYNPVVGQTYTLFTKTKTVVTKGGVESKVVTAYGDYQLKMTVLEATANGFRMRWALDSSMPNDPDGPKEGYVGNSIYAKTLDLYGAKTITVVTDKGGAPISVEEWPQIRQRLQTTMEQQPGQSGTIRSIITRVDANPVKLFEILVPGAMLLSSFQGDTREKIVIGKPQVSPRPFAIAGTEINASFRVEVDKVDRKTRTAHFKYQLDIDDVDVTNASKVAIETDAAAMPEAQRNQLTTLQRAKLNTASVRKSALGAISLDDGRTLNVDETTAVRVGLTETVTTIRARMSGGRE